MEEEIDEQIRNWKTYLTHLESYFFIREPIMKYKTSNKSEMSTDCVSNKTKECRTKECKV